MEIEFDGGYGRTGLMWVVTCKCDGCGKETKCILIDGSEGEYIPGAICKECADKLFAASEEDDHAQV